MGDLPAFAESPVRKGGDECEKGIHRSLLTAIASAAAVGEGGSASAGSAEDVKMPRAAARGASLASGSHHKDRLVAGVEHVVREAMDSKKEMGNRLEV